MEHLNGRMTPGSDRPTAPREAALLIVAQPAPAPVSPTSLIPGFDLTQYGIIGAFIMLLLVALGVLWKQLQANQARTLEDNTALRQRVKDLEGELAQRNAEDRDELRDARAEARRMVVEVEDQPPRAIRRGNR